MRVYVKADYYSDEWIFNTLRNKREVLMRKYGLKSLTFSYTLPRDENTFSVKKENEISKALIADLEKIIHVAI